MGVTFRSIFGERANPLEVGGRIAGQRPLIIKSCVPYPRVFVANSLSIDLLRKSVAPYDSYIVSYLGLLVYTPELTSEASGDGFYFILRRL